ncbi:MAG: chemotaxis protein CheD [Thermoguttaceae bacterium]
MVSCLTEQRRDEINVGMGQAVFHREPAQLTAILGSCVAITMFSSKLRAGMLSHVVLPKAVEKTAYPAKFADTAVPYMLSAFERHGIRPGEIVAKIVGGACMFGKNSKFLDIGDCNAKAAAKSLEDASVRLVASDIGGAAGRRICFDLTTGEIVIESSAHRVRTI